MCQLWALHVVTKRQFFTFIMINDKHATAVTLNISGNWHVKKSVLMTQALRMVQQSADRSWRHWSRASRGIYWDVARRAESTPRRCRRQTDPPRHSCRLRRRHGSPRRRSAVEGSVPGSRGQAPCGWRRAPSGSCDGAGDRSASTSTLSGSLFQWCTDWSHNQHTLQSARFA